MSAKEENCLTKFVRWIVERTGIEEFTSYVIPKHALHPMYSLGGLATLMFFILSITGVILLMFYVPVFGEENMAYESIRHLTEEVPYGFVIRGMHHYAATFMIALSMLHFVRVYLTGSYAKPRELTYLVGIAAGILSIFVAFLGYSLRMDHISVEAIKIGQFLVLQLPGGNWLYQLIFGTGVFDDVIARFLAFHIGLAGLLGILLLFHFYMVHRHHIAPPYDGDDPKPAIPFYPNFLLTEVAVAVVVIGLLVTISAVFPPELGFKYVYGEELPVGQPEWFLMAMYALIKTGIDPVLAGIVIPALGLLILVVMPWIDPLYSRHPRNRRIATTYLLIFIGEYMLFFIYGQLTPGQEIPLINALVLSIAVALIMGFLGLRLTSKPIPPKRSSSSHNNPSPVIIFLVKRCIALCMILLVIAIVLGGFAFMYHVAGNYIDASICLGFSIAIFGFSFFIAKVGLLDAKYLL